MPSPPFLSEVPGRTIRQEIKGTQIEKEEVKLSRFVDFLLISIETH
jgi:hypothetical protein